MKHMAKMGKIAIKKWVLRGKKWVIGGKNNGLATKIEKQNGEKCGSYS